MSQGAQATSGLAAGWEFRPSAPAVNGKVVSSNFLRALLGFA